MEEYKPELKNILSDDGEGIKLTEKNEFAGCSKCEAGYVNGKLCDCLKNEIMQRKYRNANIDYDYATLEIDEDEVIAYLKDGEAPGGKFQIDLTAFIEAYVDDIKEHIKHGKGIIFNGPVGRGKSLASQKVLKLLIDKSYNGYWLTIKQFIDIIKKSWNEDEYKTLLNFIYNCNFLVIDDLGTEYHKDGNDWALTELDSLLRHRYFKKMPVIITTNTPLEKMKEKYAQRVVSLFQERSLIVSIVSKEDYREKLSKLPDYMDVDRFKKKGE